MFLHKHALHTVPRPLGFAALTLWLMLLWVLVPCAPALASDGVELKIMSSDNPALRVELPDGEHRTIVLALAKYRKVLDSADVVLSQVQIDPYLTEDYIDHLAKYSVRLTLKNGSLLSSQLRRVHEKRLAAAVIESIQRCMTRYEKYVGDDDKKLTMSNL